MRNKQLPTGAYTILLFAGYLCGFSLGVPQGCLSAMVMDLGLTEFSAGLLFTCYATGIFLGLLIATFAMQRWGEARVVLWGVLLICVSWGGHALVRRYLPALAFFAACGLGHGASSAGASVLAARGGGLLSTRRMLWVHGFLILGVSLGALLGGYSERLSRLVLGNSTAGTATWPLGFLIVSGLAGLCVPLMVYVLRCDRHYARPAPAAFAALQRAFHNPWLWLATIMMFLDIGAETVMGAWFARYLHVGRGMTLSAAGWGISLVYGGMVVGRFLFGWYVPNLARHRVAAFAAAGFGLFSLLAILISPPLAVILGVLAGMGASMVVPYLLALISERSGPSDAASIVPLTLAVGCVAGIVFPALAGALSDATGSLRAGILLAPVLACCAAAMVVFFPVVKSVDKATGNNVE